MAKKIPPRRVPRDRFVQRGGTSGSLFGGRSIPGAHTHVEADITDLDKYTQAAADAKFVEVGGDTMTGLLLLSAVPVADLGAATKKFVDDHNWLEADITDLDKYTVAGADAAFAAISHTHLEADITDLQAYLLDITAEALGTLSDVTITAIASGELLKWNGSAFINNTLAEAGISATGHTHVVASITDFDPTDYLLKVSSFQVVVGNLAINREANETTIFTVGEFATLRGSATKGRIDIVSEKNAALVTATVQNTGSDLQLSHATGSITFGSPADVLAGGFLRVRDAANTDWAKWSHDGTDFNLVFTNTTDYNITGLTNLNVGGTAVSLVGHTHVEANITDLQAYLLDITAEALGTLSDVTITAIASGELLKWSGTAWINNTLAEAGISATGHTHVEANITDLQSYLVSPLTTSGDVLYYNAGHQRLAKGTNAQVLTLTAGLPAWEDAASGGVTDHGALTGLGDDDHTQYAKLAGDTFVGNVIIGAGSTLSVQDAGDTDKAVWSHDGTDFDLVFTNTAAYDITGAARARYFMDLQVRSAKSFYVMDTSNTKWARFRHDGTNFLNIMTNTAQWNITGLTTHFSVDAAIRIPNNTPYNAINQAGTGSIELMKLDGSDVGQFMPGAQAAKFSGALNVVGALTENSTQVSLVGHTHVEADITDLQAYLLDITGEALGTLSDVTITAIASGEILKWNGSAFINNTLAEAGVSATGHQHVEADITDLGAYLLLTGGTLSGNLTLTNGQINLGNTTSGFPGLPRFILSGDAGGWARGWHYYNSSLAIIGGIGALGSGDTFTYAYLGYGASPHDSANALTVASGVIQFENTDVSLAGHTHLEADVTDLQSYLLDITAEALGTLSDVTITAIASGELLKWNGSAFINNTLAEAGISATSHNHDHGALTGLGDDDHTQYAKLAGDTFAGIVLFDDFVRVDNDTKKFTVGTNNDGQFYHDGTNTFFRNNTGDLRVYNTAATGKVTLWTNTTLALTIDASQNAQFIGTITSGGTAVSLAGHTHTESDITDLGSYLPLAGGTLTGVLTLDAQRVMINDVTPGIRFNETDGGVDQKIWEWRAAGDQFQIRLVNDAQSAGTIAFKMGRSGQAPSYALFNTPSLQVNTIANANTWMYIGEGNTARGTAQRGKLRIYGENGASTITHATFESTGSNLNITHSTGNIQFGSQVDVLSGKGVYIRDAANADFFLLNHDGTDANITFGGTTKLNITGIPLNLTSGANGLHMDDSYVLSRSASFVYLYSPDGSQVLKSGNTAMELLYDTLTMKASDGTARMVADSAGFRPSATGGMSLGTATYDWDDGWFTGNLNLGDTGSLIQTASSAGGSVWTPGGANWYSSNSSKTGAITIRIPNDALADMLTFTIQVYEHVNNKCFTVFVGGYASQTQGGTEWGRYSAYIVQDPHSTENYTVRFGHDGTNHLVYIGELSDVWSYPQVQVFNFSSGYTTTIANYDDGWDVYWEASAFEGSAIAITDIVVGGPHTHVEADITDLQSYLLDITGEALGTLSDVTISAIASGELLKWNGSAFINNTLAEAGISATGHTHVEANITDLQSYLVSPLTTGGDILYYNSGHQRLAKGTDDQVLTLASGIPSWADAAGGGGIAVTVSTLAPSGSASDGDLWCRV